MLKQIYFWLALSWSGLILISCLIQSNEIPKVHIQNLDKVAHAFFYFVFAWLWYLSFKKHLKGSKPLVVSFVFSVFFGIFIEILQGLCTTTRNANVFDVLANTTGAILAVMAIFLWNKYSKNAKKVASEK